jgi:hypothetical protein
MNPRTGRILTLIGTIGLAIIALIQLIRGDYVSAGAALFGALMGVLILTVIRRADSKRL